MYPYLCPGRFGLIPPLFHHLLLAVAQQVQGLQLCIVTEQQSSMLCGVCRRVRKCVSTVEQFAMCGLGVDGVVD